MGFFDKNKSKKKAVVTTPAQRKKAAMDKRPKTITKNATKNTDK